MLMVFGQFIAHDLVMTLQPGEGTNMQWPFLEKDCCKEQLVALDRKMVWSDKICFNIEIRLFVQAG